MFHAIDADDLRCYLNGPVMHAKEVLDACDCNVLMALRLVDLRWMQTQDKHWLAVHAALAGERGNA